MQVQRKGDTLVISSFNPDGDSNTMKEIEEWAERHQGYGVYEIIPLPDVRLSENSLKGVVFVCSPQTPAISVAGGLKDIGGAVSIYPIKEFNGSFDPDSMLAMKAKDLKENGTSSLFLDASLTENFNYMSKESDLSLGSVNCSIGVERFTSDEKVNWVVIVRSYHIHSSIKVEKMIRENPKLTIEELYSSVQYKNAISDGKVSRDAIASALMDYIGATPYGERIIQKFSSGKPYNTLKPLSESPYNNLTRFQSYKSDLTKPIYVFYRYAYGIPNSMTSAIPVGLGRHRGWVIYAPSESKTMAIGSMRTYGAFPMGVPRKNQSNEKIPSATITPEKSVVVWGAKHSLHEKTGKVYDETFYLKNRAIDELGFKDKIANIYRQRLTYISSPNEQDLSIRRIIEITPIVEGRVKVPVHHEFLRTFMMQEYSKRKNQDPRFRMTDLIKKETDFYFEIDVKDIQDILSHSEGKQ